MIRVISFARQTDEGARQLSDFAGTFAKVRETVTSNGGEIEHIWQTAGEHDFIAVDAYNAWVGYVVGFTAIEMKPPELAPEPDLRRAMRTQLAALDHDLYAMVTRLPAQVVAHAYGLSWKPEPLGEARSSFNWGLKALLDAIDP